MSMPPGYGRMRVVAEARREPVVPSGVMGMLIFVFTECMLFAGLISGFTIRNGYTTSSDGGGIFASGASLTVEDCVIENCSAPNNGGGVFFGYNTRLGRSIIKDCVLRDNHVESRGGGLMVSHGAAKIIGCTFVGNSTTGDDSAGEGGGAVMCHTIYETTPIASCTFVGNSSALNGSDIHSYSALNVIVRTSIMAFDSGGPAMTAGGGAYARGGQIWVMNADGTGCSQLTASPNRRNAEDPTWSPDGTKILFTTGRRGLPELWMMDADGSYQVPLFPPDPYPFPGRASWQPVARGCWQSMIR